MRKVSAGDARIRFAEIINEAAERSQRTVITRHGKEIAVLVPMADVEELAPGAIQILQTPHVLSYSQEDLIKGVSEEKTGRR